MSAKRCLSRLHRLLTTSNTEDMNSRKEMEKAMKIASLRLGHVPYIISNSRKMAVWSDVKEILLWCPNPQCSIVLNSMKSLFSYPKSETAMHPCSQLEQLLFLKHFMFITHGTLLVDLNSISDTAYLAVLYEVVKKSHANTHDPVINDCCKMLKTLTQKYANTSFKIPINSNHRKRFMPAVRREVKYRPSSNQHNTHGDDGTQGDGSDRPKLEPASVETSRLDGTNQSQIRTLVPLALLAKMYPGCHEFLEQVVQLYLLGRCQEENLFSVCHCTVEEGIQLTRFLASQNGYDRPWWCLTSANLMMSWSEFWSGLEKMHGAVIVSMSSDVCVVTLNCQTTEEKERRKVRAKWTAPVQLSPPLSPVTVITENVRQRTKYPLKKLSMKDTDKALEMSCKQLGVQSPSVKQINVQSSPCTKNVKLESKAGNDDVANISKKDEHIEFRTSVSDKNEQDDTILRDEAKNETVTDNKEEKALTEQFKNTCRPCRDGTGETNEKEEDTKALHNSNNSEMHVNQPDKSECNMRKGRGRPRATNHLKKNKVKTKTTNGTSSKGIKSRLRSNSHVNNTVTEEDEQKPVSKTDENNSALSNSSSSKVEKCGLGDSSTFQTKSEETIVLSNMETFIPVYSGSRKKTEMPVSEVSNYDIMTMASPNITSIEVSLKPKLDEEVSYKDIPDEICNNTPLFEKPKISKKAIECCSFERNERKSSKLSSAQLIDEIPETLRCAQKGHDPHRKCSQSADAISGQTHATNDDIKDRDYRSFSTYKSSNQILTPRQIELSTPILGGPDPKVVKESSKRIHYKGSKTPDIFSQRESVENVKRESMLTDNRFPLIEGKNCYKEKQIHGRRIKKLSTESAKDHYQVPLHQQQLTKTQTDGSYTGKNAYSVLSLKGNQCKRQKRKDRRSSLPYDSNKDLNSTEFLKERITMWKDQVEQSMNIPPSPGRQAKSARSVKNPPRTFTHRPKSSMLEPKYSNNCQACFNIKSALSAVCSRDFAEQKDRVRNKDQLDTAKEILATQTDEKKVEEDIPRPQTESSSSMSGSMSLSSGLNRRDTPDNAEQGAQNYGCSSSTTPDIYDVYARKRKPKIPKPDPVQLKSKQVTSQVSSTVSQPQIHSPVQQIEKANNHNVGHISDMKQTDQGNKRLNSSSPSKEAKLVYHYNNESQNRPCNSMTRNVNNLKDDELKFSMTKAPNPISSEDSRVSVSNKLLNSTEKVDTILPTPKSQQGPDVVHSIDTDHLCKGAAQQMNCLTNKSESLLYSRMEEASSNKKTLLNSETKNVCSETNIRDTVTQKMLSYVDYNVTQGKVESLDYVNGIHSIFGTNPIQSSSSDGTSQSNLITEHQQPEYKIVESGKQLAIGQSNYSTENKINNIKDTFHQPLTKKPEEQTLSKVNTQLYFKVPGDDELYRVSENIIIPKDAQFFLQTNSSECKDIASATHFEKDSTNKKDTMKERESFRNTLERNNQGKNIPVNSKQKYQGVQPNDRNTSTGTTFNCILKASEEIIDASKQSKHQIEKSLETEQEQCSDESTVSDENYEEDTSIKEIHDGNTLKVIIPSFGSVVEKKQPSTKKSFKTVVEERRAEKRRLQEELAKKKYWNSAYIKKVKDANNRKVLVKMVADKVQHNKNAIENTRNTLRKNTEYRKQQYNTSIVTGKFNARFEVCSKTQSNSYLRKEKLATTQPSGVNRLKKDELTAKEYQDNLDKRYPSTKNSKTTKSGKMFPKTNHGKCNTNMESEDCTNKILTALRRLSIEKVPKENAKESSKTEARQRKLRSCVVKQVSRMSPTKSISKSNDITKSMSEPCLQAHLMTKEILNDNVVSYINDSSKVYGTKDMVSTDILTKVVSEENHPNLLKENTDDHMIFERETENYDEVQSIGIEFQPLENEDMSLPNTLISSTENKQGGQYIEAEKETFITQSRNTEFAWFDPVAAQSDSSVGNFQQLYSNNYNIEHKHPEIISGATLYQNFNQNQTYTLQQGMQVQNEDTEQINGCPDMLMGVMNVDRSKLMLCQSATTSSDTYIHDDACNTMVKNDIYIGATNTVGTYCNKCAATNLEILENPVANSPSINGTLLNGPDAHVNEVIYTYTDDGLPNNQFQLNGELFETVEVMPPLDRTHTCDNVEKDVVVDNPDEMFQYVFETRQELNGDNYLQSSECIDESVQHIRETTNTSENQDYAYIASVIDEDCGHDYQPTSPYQISERQIPPSEYHYVNENSKNSDDNYSSEVDEVVLDETDCGQVVCIGGEDTYDNTDDLEKGVLFYENNEISEHFLTHSNHLQFNEQTFSDTGGITSESNDDMLQEDNMREAFEGGVDAKRSNGMYGLLANKSLDKTNEKEKDLVKPNLELRSNADYQRYSPLQSEVDEYFDEMKKRAEMVSPSSAKCQDSPVATHLSYSNATTAKGKFNNLNNGHLDFKSKNDRRTMSQNVIYPQAENISYEEEEGEEEEVNSSGDFGDGESDKDYNPDADVENSSESGDSETDDTEYEQLTSGNYVRSKSTPNTDKLIKYTEDSNIANRKIKRCSVSLEKIRKQFQKKYDIKNNSTVNNLKQKFKTGEKNIEEITQRKCSNLAKKTESVNGPEMSIIREFCSKKNERLNQEEVQLETGKKQVFDDTLSKNDASRLECSTKYKKSEIKKNESEKVKSRGRPKKSSKNISKDVEHNEDEHSDEEKKSAAAEGLIKTQKLYYDILKNKSLGATKEEVHELAVRSEERPQADALSEVIEAVPLVGERVISKAASDAEKALEGTGSLENINNNEHEGTVIEDLINQCSYQLIEDEDHIQLGGVAYFHDCALPFVYLNGYKFTPLKDALSIFTPACCISACTIPRSVLQKCKALAKTLSAWEQVYKLELIKMKKGPSIMTGDSLVKLDSLLVQLPELIDQIVEKHVGTKLKRSKTCDLNQYKVLRAKFK